MIDKYNGILIASVEGRNRSIQVPTDRNTPQIRQTVPREEFSSPEKSRWRGFAVRTNNIQCPPRVSLVSR